MQCRNTILKKVRNCIDNELNPSKKNFLDKIKDDYVELKSIEEIPSLLEISPKKHFQFLMAVGFKLITKEYQIHVSRITTFVMD